MNAFNSYAFIQDARLAYYKHLYEERGQRLHIDSGPEHEEDTDWVYASSLGICPLQKAHERFQTPQKFPATDEEMRVKYSFFEQGNSAEDFIIEACTFFWTRTYVVLNQRQYGLEGTNWKCKGRADMVAMGDDGVHIFEIKRPQSNFTPKKSQIFQTLFYGACQMAIDPSVMVTMHLVIRSGIDVTIWDFIPDGHGFILKDAYTGDVWDDPLNDPNLLNFDAMEAEIQYHQLYLTGGAASPPVEDPITDERGWLCVYSRRGDDPKVYKTERNANRFAPGETTKLTIQTPDGEEQRHVRPGRCFRRCHWLCFADHDGPYAVWPTSLDANGNVDGTIIDWNTEVELD